MAWIESHQSLRAHPKLLAVCSAIKANRHAVIGHLHCLWWWGLDIADDDGWLPAGTTAIGIAMAAEWPEKRAQAWQEALLTAGFLEQQGGRFRLHDWWSYAGRLNAKRAANRERMRDARGGHVQRTECGGAAHVQGLPTNQTNLTNQPTKPEEDNPLLPKLNIFKLYEQHIGATFGPAVGQEMAEAEEEYTPECIKHCFEEADTHNKRSWAYVRAILKRHKETGSCYDWKGEKAGESEEEAEINWFRRRSEEAQAAKATQETGGLLT